MTPEKTTLDMVIDISNAAMEVRRQWLHFDAVIGEVSAHQKKQLNDTCRLLREIQAFAEQSVWEQQSK